MKVTTASQRKVGDLKPGEKFTYEGSVYTRLYGYVGYNIAVTQKGRITSFPPSTLVDSPPGFCETAPTTPEPQKPEGGL